jgi:hypothetical protein
VDRLADESKWRFRDALHEDNASDIFWSSVKSYIEGDEKSALAKIKENPSIIQSIASKHVTDNKSMMFVQVTRGTLANIIIEMFFKIDAIDCIKGLVRDTAGSLYLTIGLSKFIEENKKAEALVKEMLVDESIGLETMKAIRKSSSETIARFLEQIMECAKNEIGEKQYISLQLLAEHVDNKAVRKIMMDFLDDWDAEVRRICALSLAHFKDDDEVNEAASKALEVETEEDIKLLLIKLTGGTDGPDDNQDT